MLWLVSILGMECNQLHKRQLTILIVIEVLKNKIITAEQGHTVDVKTAKRASLFLLSWKQQIKFPINTRVIMIIMSWIGEPF